MDTITSLLAGVIIFGILGNLAYESGTDDIKQVVKGGSGLAFVSYPDAIAKFKFVPQVIYEISRLHCQLICMNFIDFRRYFQCYSF